MICPIYTAPLYFFFSTQVPPLFYYSHIPSMLVSIALGVFVLLNNKGNLLNKIFFCITASFTLWVLTDMVLWTNNNSDIIIYIWSFTDIVFTSIFTFCLYFIYVFCTKRDASFKAKLIVAISLLPVFILAPTHYYLQVVDLDLCGITVEGDFYNAYYAIYCVIISILICYIGFKYYQKAEKSKKQEIGLMVVGIMLFLLTFFISSVVASYLVDQGIVDNYQLEWYGLLGMLFFCGFVSYLIVKFHTFNIKLVGSFVLVLSLATLNFSMLFITQVETLRIVTTITFLLAIIFGIALIKSILREIRQNQAIEQLVKARSEFLTVASHQLRTPVSLITGTLSLMQDGTLEQLPPDQKTKLLEGIFVKSRKLTNIINDILQASEMDIMNFKLSKEAIQPLDLQVLLKKIHTDLQEKAEANKLTFTYEQAANDKAIMVSGNGHYLEEALANVVDNAIKYTPKGFVKIELLAHETNTNKVVVKISDSGIGVPLEDQPKLFEKFKRAKNAVNSYADGSGLGLFIVKKIIEAHPGGKIYFISAGEDKGTTFYIELTTTS